ncbi:MAG: glycosyltransferase family 2 protein [Verrucomicrobiota bacterium]
MAASEEVVITVVLVSRNTCALTCAAIKSVFESQDGFKKEVVVVDNGSTDDTAATVARDFPQVKFIGSKANLGFAGGNNLGAKEMRGEFLLLLNSDARLKPDVLEKVVNWMRANPKCGIAGVQLLNPDGSRQNSIANLPSLATELLNKSLLRRLFPKRFPGKEQKFAEPIEVESVIGAFMMIRANVWREIGGFDERYFFFLEETDFCREVLERGWKIFHLPQVEVWHGQGQSARQTPVPVRVEYWRSRYIYFRKNYGTLTNSILRMGLWVRLFFDWISGGLMMLMTTGKSERWRHRWELTTTLWKWNFRGCPAEMGLPR